MRPQRRHSGGVVEGVAVEGGAVEGETGRGRVTGTLLLSAGRGRVTGFLSAGSRFFTRVWRAGGKLLVARMAIQGQDICAFDFVEPFFQF